MLDLRTNDRVRLRANTLSRMYKLIFVSEGSFAVQVTVIHVLFAQQVFMSRIIIII